MKIIFTIINGLFALISLKLLLLSFQQESLLSLILPSFFLFLFLINITSIWKHFPIWARIIQIALTLLTIPVVNTIYSVSLPFAKAIAQALLFSLDEEKLRNIDLFINGVLILLALSASHIAYQTYQQIKNKNQATQTN